jgi:hypothetical protein
VDWHAIAREGRKFVLHHAHPPGAIGGETVFFQVGFFVARAEGTVRIIGGVVNGQEPISRLGKRTWPPRALGGNDDPFFGHKILA